MRPRTMTSVEMGFPSRGGEVEPWRKSLRTAPLSNVWTPGGPSTLGLREHHSSRFRTQFLHLQAFSESLCFSVQNGEIGCGLERIRFVRTPGTMQAHTRCSVYQLLLLLLNSFLSRTHTSCMVLAQYYEQEITGKV